MGGVEGDGAGSFSNMAGTTGAGFGEFLGLTSDELANMLDDLAPPLPGPFRVFMVLRGPSGTYTERLEEHLVNRYEYLGIEIKCYDNDDDDGKVMFSCTLFANEDNFDIVKGECASTKKTIQGFDVGRDDRKQSSHLVHEKR